MRTTVTKHLLRYSFLLAMAGTIVLAKYFPEAGRAIDPAGRFFSASKLAIVGLFFLSGLSVSLKSINRDLSNWGCHGLIQLYMFGITPAALFLTAFWLPEGSPLKYGIYVLAPLPTTISSCVAFTTAARGNSLCAIINAVGSNVAGVVISPLIVGLMLGSSGLGGFATISRTVLDMVVLVLIPFAAGELLTYRFPMVRERMKGMQSALSQGLVLLLAYCALSKSLDRLSEQIHTMWQCFAYLAAMHVLLVGGALLLGRAVLRTREDRIAMLFCSTQKTMAFGLPVAYAFFAHTEVPIAIVVLPIVFNYVFQLVFGSMLSHWIVSRQVPAEAVEG